MNGGWDYPIYHLQSPFNTSKSPLDHDIPLTISYYGLFMHIIIYVYFPIINIPSKRIQKRPSVAPGDNGSHPLLQWKHTAEGVLGLGGSYHFTRLSGMVGIWIVYLYLSLIYIYVCMYVCLSVCLSIYLSLSLCGCVCVIYLFDYVFICISFHIYISIYITYKVVPQFGIAKLVASITQISRGSMESMDISNWLLNFINKQT